MEYFFKALNWFHNYDDSRSKLYLSKELVLNWIKTCNDIPVSNSNSIIAFTKGESNCTMKEI